MEHGAVHAERVTFSGGLKFGPHAQEIQKIAMPVLQVALGSVEADKPLQQEREKKEEEMIVIVFDAVAGV
jgi:hypothetical protein